MEIGSKIKKSRIDAKLTQEQAAETLGISRQTISNWENEKSYHDNKAIDEKHILLWEQIMRVI